MVESKFWELKNVLGLSEFWFVRDAKTSFKRYKHPHPPPKNQNHLTVINESPLIHIHSSQVCN